MNIATGLMAGVALAASSCIYKLPYDTGPHVADFCGRHGSHPFCTKEAPRGKAGSLQDVRQINRQVNQSIRFSIDAMQVNGKFDRWASGVTVGDCEDYALTKYKLLHESGFTPKLLLFYVNSGGIGGQYLHAVTTVEVDGKIWVLDNVVKDIYPYSELPLFKRVEWL